MHWWQEREVWERLSHILPPSVRQGLHPPGEQLSLTDVHLPFPPPPSSGWKEFLSDAGPHVLSVLLS